MLTTLIAAVLVLGPVIVFHEFGHFIVAKLAGIYVKTFSVGFGPKLLKWRAGETEYCISALPLGGYVRMAGEAAEEPVAESAEAAAPEAAGAGSGAGSGTESELAPAAGASTKVGEAMLYPRDVQTDADIPPHRFLRNKPIATRLAVVTAGPFANLLLAIVVLTVARHQEGIPVLPTTTLDAFPAESAEARAGFRAGDEIVSIGGRPVRSTLDVSQALEAQGDTPFDVVVRRTSGVDTTIALAGVRRARGGEFFPDFRYRSEARIGTVKKDGPAARAGLLPGDRIVEVDGEPIRYYDELASRIRPAIGKPLQIVWERNGERQNATVTPEAGDAPDPENPNKLVQVGRLQIEMHREMAPVGWGTAFRSSLASTWFLTRATFEFLGQVVRGKGSRDAVGGPIRIAQEAGSELRWGLSRLFTFMAFFSVNLFLLNLLPIPVLDGGHVLFLLIEAVRGEALSTRVQEWALRVGVSALIALMGWVVAMDLWRVISR